MDIYEWLTPIFQNVFDNDTVVATADLSADQVEGWDSLGHVRLIVAIEQAFGITLSTAEMTGLENVGQLVGVIERKLP